MTTDVGISKETKVVLDYAVDKTAVWLRIVGDGQVSIYVPLQPDSRIPKVWSLETYLPFLESLVSKSSQVLLEFKESLGLITKCETCGTLLPKRDESEVQG